MGLGPRSRIAQQLALAAALLLALAGTSACGSQEPGVASADEPVTVRLGYFPNITHAPAIAGIEKGFFESELGSAGRLEIKTFNAGPQAVEALFSDALDMTYIGPNPAVNAFQKSKGEAIRIVSGSTSGGAALVVKPGIKSASDLVGKTLATPQLGNTQDVALRSWLEDNGLQADTQGGGDVSIHPQENAQTLETFRSGDIQGAWVPEPWATRLVREGGGEVLVDERNLWPEGRFTTTQLVVRTEFLEKHPDVVERVLRAHVEAVDFVNNPNSGAPALVNAAVGRVTGKTLPDEIVDEAWSHLTFTDDPVASSLRKSAQDAEDVGLVAHVDLDGIYDLALLNGILQQAGKPAVAS